MHTKPFILLNSDWLIKHPMKRSYFENVVVPSKRFKPLHGVFSYQNSWKDKETGIFTNHLIGLFHELLFRNMNQKLHTNTRRLHNFYDQEFRGDVDVDVDDEIYELSNSDSILMEIIQHPIVWKETPSRYLEFLPDQFVNNRLLWDNVVILHSEMIRPLLHNSNIKDKLLFEVFSDYPWMMIFIDFVPGKLFRGLYSKTSEPIYTLNGVLDCLDQLPALKFVHNLFQRIQNPSSCLGTIQISKDDGLDEEEIDKLVKMSPILRFSWLFDFKQNHNMVRKHVDVSKIVDVVGLNSWQICGLLYDYACPNMRVPYHNALHHFQTHPQLWFLLQDEEKFNSTVLEHLSLRFSHNEQDHNLNCIFFKPYKYDDPFSRISGISGKKNMDVIMMISSDCKFREQVLIAERLFRWDPIFFWGFDYNLQKYFVEKMKIDPWSYMNINKGREIWFFHNWVYCLPQDFLVDVRTLDIIGMFDIDQIYGKLDASQTNKYNRWIFYDFACQISFDLLTQHFSLEMIIQMGLIFWKKIAMRKNQPPNRQIDVIFKWED